MDKTEGGRLATFPRRLLDHGKTRPERPAFREKYLGLWQAWTWRETNAEVRALACGLAALGFRRGMNLAIIGDNRPHLYWAMLAAQALGGVPVPLYQDAPAADMAYVLQDAEVAYAVVEDQEQVDKLLELQEQCPLLHHIVYEDARGMRHYSQGGLQSFAALQEMGRAYDRAHPGFYEQAIEQGRASDPAIILYTSGTTGKPKGVVQSHAALIAAGEGGVGFDRLTDREDVLSYLPMAWVGDCLFSLAQAMVAGFTVNCPESSDTVLTDMREIGPTYYFAPPRIFENLLTTVMIRMEDAGALKRGMFHYFMEVARRCGSDILDGKPVPPRDRALYALGRVLVYGPLKNVLGMSRIRVAYTAGAAIGPDLFRFYRSIGVNLKQLYGSTETCAYVCLQPDGQIKFDSVGKPAPGVEIKLADNGEVLVKSCSTMEGYYKRPDATAEVLDGAGYFHTGDAGLIDEEGHLKIIDRAADVGRMNDGAMFAP
ncbi:MAG TPA: AMP-binding protein, partial [Telluria sp.]|nr:AMP-binding protein [Telluria sp.]